MLLLLHLFFNFLFLFLKQAYCHGGDWIMMVIRFVDCDGRSNLGFQRDFPARQLVFFFVILMLIIYQTLATMVAKKIEYGYG